MFSLQNSRGATSGLARRVLVGFLLALPILAACQPYAAAPVQPATRTVRFMAGYKPQANLPFAAAYIAKDMGFFTTQGLDVEITHDAGGGGNFKLLMQGTVDITTAVADDVLTLRADQNLPVVSVALLGQRSQGALAVLADSPIQSPKDWEGRTVGYKIYPSPSYLALLDKAGVDRSKIKEVPVGFDPRLLAAGQVDVYPVFESNEPDTLERLGVPVRLFRPTDYGVPALGLTYMVRQQLLSEDADLVTRFVKAALHAVEYARANPEEATDIVMRYAPQEDRTHQLAMLQVELGMTDSPATEGKGVGWSTREQWQALHDSLLQFGGIQATTSVDDAFTNQVLQSVYRDGQLLWP